MGPRRAGKTTLVRKMGEAGRTYITLDDQTVLDAAQSDPVGFIRGLDKAIIDEIQRAPDLLLAIDAATQEKIAQRYHARYEGGVLSDDLVTFARVFQDWRYSYEFAGAHEMDQTGVAHLASALYETCAELRPDLVQPGQVHDRLVTAAQGVPI